MNSWSPALHSHLTHRCVNSCLGELILGEVKTNSYILSFLEIVMAQLPVVDKGQFIPQRQLSCTIAAKDQATQWANLPGIFLFRYQNS